MKISAIHPLHRVRAWFARETLPPVFFGAASVAVAFAVLGMVAPGAAHDVFQKTEAVITARFAWYYAVLVSVALLTCAVLLLGPWRRVRLGDSEPEFDRLSWATMLFAAGMGIGLVFWAVAEVLLHVEAPLPELAGESPERRALRWAFFHWGLHPWAIYAVFGLAVAHFHFNRGLPLAPRSILYPLLGDRIHGAIGHVADVLCTVGTLLGVSTSLGLGAMQINAGLAEFSSLGQSRSVQVTLIVLITVAATVSVVLGLQSGVRRLSRAALVLAALFLVFGITVGPTRAILENLVTTTGAYVQQLPRMSLAVGRGERFEWQTDWTFFYWGWWISWSPFVAIFVARISKGRTVGEFVLGVVTIPTLATFAWFAAFGTAAIESDSAQLAAVVQDDVSLAFHRLLKTMPLSGWTLPLATLLIILFFVTSSDSGSLVDDMVTSGGNPDPPKPLRVFWATSEGVLAAVLLIVGGLDAMRSASISLGLPMSLLVAAAIVSLFRDLRRD